TWTLGNDTLVTNDLTVTDGTLDTSAFNLQVSGAMALVDTDGTLDFSSSLIADVLNLDAVLDVNGTLLGGAGTIQASENVDFTGGAFTKGTGVFEFDGVAPSKTLVAAGEDLGDIDVSGLMTLSDTGDFDDVTVSGTFATGQNFTVAGDWNDSGTVTISGGTVTFDNIGAQSYTSDGDSFSNVQIGDGTNDSALTLNNDMTLTGSLGFGAAGGSAIDFSDDTLTIGGNGDFSAAGAVTTNAASLLLFNANGNQNFDPGGYTFGDVTKGGLSGTLSLLDAVTVSDTLTISAGTIVDMQANNFTVGTLVNDNVLQLEGTQGTQSITTMDVDTGQVEYDGVAGGTVRIASFYDLLIDGVGTFTLNSAIDVNNDLDIAGGMLDVSGSDFQITLDGNWTNSDTFAARNGTVVFNDSSTVTTTITSPFYNVTLGTAGAGTLITSSDMEIDGVLSIINTVPTTLNIDSDTLTVAGHLDFSSLDTFVETNSTVVFDGAVNQNLTSSGFPFNNITISGISVTLQDITDVNGNMLVSTGTLIDNAQTISFFGDVDFTGGAFTATGTAVFDGNSAVTSNSQVFFNVTLGSTAAGSVLTTNDQMEIDGVISIQNIGNTTIDISGDSLLIDGDLDLTNLDTFTVAGSTVLFDGTANQDLTSNTLPFNNLELDGTSVTLLDPIDVNGNIQITNGTFDSGSQNMNIAGDWTDNGTFTHNNNRVIFDGTGSITTNETFYELEKAGGTTTLQAGSSALTIDKGLLLSSGILAANDNTITFSATADTFDSDGDGNAALDPYSGIFQYDTSTVVFQNPGTISIWGDNSFYNFSYQIAGGTILFGAGKRQTIYRNMTIRGVSGNLITLDSTNSPTQWELEIDFPSAGGSATATFEYVNVINSHAINPITPDTTCNDGGNNTNWFFFIAIVVSWAEDSDLNGRLDRIRVRVESVAILDDPNRFDDVTAWVDGYEVDTSYNSVLPYGLNGFSDSDNSIASEFFIHLVEKEYTDTDVTPQWRLMTNTSLFSTTGGALVEYGVAVPSETPIDNAAPIYNYTLSSSEKNKIYVQFSEYVRQPDETVIEAVDFSYGGAANISSLARITTSGTGTKELELTLDALVTADEILNGAILQIVNDIDDMDNWNDTWGTFAANYPSADPTAIPDLATGNVGDSNNPMIGGGTASGAHRVSDLALGLTGDAILQPVYATDESQTDPDRGGIGTIRDFTGGTWLQDQPIELTTHINSGHSAPSGLDPQVQLFFDVDVPSAYRQNNDRDGLWLPGVSFGNVPAADDYDIYDFYGIVPSPNPDEREATAGTSPSNQLRVHSFDNDDPELESVADVEFLYYLPAYSLFAARIENSSASDWYRQIKPWTFAIHDITTQVGGVTILKNVINPENGETTNLHYELAEAGMVTIQVFDISGAMVDVLQRGRQEAGEYSTAWDGHNSGGRIVARGVYFIRIVAPGIDETRKVMVVK
ncbi:FlgD immunoglobulin-like domain containing protein, partial [Spirochaeta isovalerica]